MLLASGHTKLGEIRDYIGAKGTDISPYLRNLIDVELVVRKTPLIDNVKSRILYLILMTFSPDALSSIFFCVNSC